MSEATAKADRRDLRRAVGTSGLAIINEHATTLLALHDSHDALVTEHLNLANRVGLQHEWQRYTGDRVSALDTELTRASQQLDTLRRLIESVGRDGVWFRHMTLWRRLRWLVTGRTF